MVSVDIAPECIELARARAATAGLRCEIREQAFGEVQDGPYAAVLSLYDRSVCGFPSEAEDARSLRHLGGLLEPGGWLVFGINDWPAGLPEAGESREETGDGVELVEVVPDPVTMTCTHRVTLTRPDGRQERHALTRRHYSLRELRRLVDGKRIRPARRAPSSRRGTAVRRRRRGSVPLRAARLRTRLPGSRASPSSGGGPGPLGPAGSRAFGRAGLSCPGQGRAEPRAPGCGPSGRPAPRG